MPGYTRRKYCTTGSKTNNFVNDILLVAFPTDVGRTFTGHIEYIFDQMYGLKYVVGWKNESSSPTRVVLYPSNKNISSGQRFVVTERFQQSEYLHKPGSWYSQSPRVFVMYEPRSVVRTEKSQDCSHRAPALFMMALDAATVGTQPRHGRARMAAEGIA